MGRSLSTDAFGRPHSVGAIRALALSLACEAGHPAFTVGKGQ
jgi:hypothetical protein